GQAPRPTSRHATLEYLRLGREDSQPVTVEGVVRSMRIETGHLYVEVGSGSGHFQCLLPGFWQKSAPTNLVDALVQVNGVCGTLFNQRRQLVGIQLFVQDLADIAVLKPAPDDPYGTPFRPISALLRFSPEDVSGHRAHIQGTVTLQRRGEYFFVQDETGGVQVHTVQTNELQPGDRVAVLGFPENTGYTPDLQDAVFRKLGAGAKPAAIPVTPEQALGTNFYGDLFDGRLVQMEARVLEYLPRLTAPTLILEAQGRTFYAVAMDSSQRGWMRALHREDQVRVTGVCSVQVAPDGVPQSFQLLLGKFSDLLVLARAPWLTFQRMLLALGGLGLICLLGLAWVVLLKHQVQQHTAELLLSNNLLKTEIQERNKAETALRDRETQLRLALEAARMGTWDWDIQAGRTAWSLGHEALWGYAPGTFPGTFEAYESRLHPDDVEGARRAGQKALDEHTNYEHEYRIRWPDGTMRWVASRGQPFYGPDDRPTRMVGVAMDITERKRAEEELRRDEARFRSLTKVLQYRGETTQDFLDFALQEAIALTGSKLGYIYFYHEDRKLFVLNTWSKEVMNECTIANPQTCYELDKTGLWGEAVRQRRPILLNDFQAAHPLKKGYPEGHAPLHKYLTLPIFGGDQIVAVVAVANKERDYDEKDIHQLRLLMDAVWKVVEQRKAVESLGASEERFRTLVETAPDAIFIQTNSRFAYVNAAAFRLFGAARPEALLGQPVLDRFHPAFRTRVSERIRSLNEERQPVPALDEVYLRLDGSPVGVSVSAVPFNYQNQAGALVFARDITERKRAEAEAALNTLRTQMLLELHQLAAAPREQVLDFALEASLRITQSRFSFLGLMDDTETVMTIHRWSKEAMTQCTLTSQPTIFPIAEAGLWGDCVRQRKPVLVNDYAAPHPGKKGLPEGHVPIHRFLAVPIFDGQRLVAGAAVANKLGDYTQADSAALTSLMNELWGILQRKQAEEEIRQLNQTLEQRVRERTAQLEAINQELEAFSYSVSHDLRAPLRGIDGWAQALLEDFGDKLGKTGLELLHRQRAASQRMGTLIDDLLWLSRLARQPLARQTVAPATLVHQVWEELRSAQPSQTAELVAGALPECQADASLLRQVFVNLLGNAVKFSSGHAHPRIEVGSQTGSDDPCVYFVKDNGAGFDMRYAHKLFGAFQRLHSAHEFPGTGIGLAITQRIIRRHGGRIWAESAVGQGATFFFTLAGKQGSMKHEKPSAI
ncbi:MAG: GAF domain-containing protein, partial [Verrucomicrobia bacterium]|nr:GAF domain-containing protein [Verrucomicrobiota bacterium]